MEALQDALITREIEGAGVYLSFFSLFFWPLGSPLGGSLGSFWVLQVEIQEGGGRRSRFSSFFYGDYGGFSRFRRPLFNGDSDF